ncbi:MAG: sugar nucleotide-binding protein [Patescibacteria group bacterium]|nr:sugar nucleotide-binding protein [Patescibacteria group bacterium]MCL5224334.1 sugar nucleotide-binding protein [Patescibacteria group bacterium]
MEKTKQKNILFTGGNGLLGSEFHKILPHALYPSRKEFDVSNIKQMSKYLGSKAVKTIIHAAAFTSPPKVEADPEEAITTNILGTANVVRLCLKRKIKLVYISTDYVFKGDKGNYKEVDPVYPVNKYAWSKLGGECAVRMYDNSVIIRTTFGPNVFPYEKAFADQWTSRESVSVIAGMILKVVKSGYTGIIHVGGKRKTVYDYAKRLSPEKHIGKLYIREVSFSVPADTSLDTKLFRNVIHDR